MALNNITYVVITLLGLVVINKVIDLLVPRLASVLTTMTDKADSTDRVFALRRLDTFLGIGAAMIRALLVCVVLYLAWHTLMPSTAPIALLGAGAFVAIVASNTIGTLLKDVTFGTMMIAERWYNVGDHITIEPFGNLSGVVEQLTPRSTKLRSLTGEAIWVHNQHIQGARVTSRGVRTIALDIFVSNPEAGKAVISQAIRTLPTGPTMLAKQLKISETEKLGDGLWRITAVGQTTPGREWLIEDFAMKAIAKYDGLADGEPTIVHGPIARNADATAERRFRRSVRARA